MRALPESLQWLVSTWKCNAGAGFEFFQLSGEASLLQNNGPG